MNIVALCGFVLVAAVVSVTLKKYLPEYALLVNILSGVLILIAIFSSAVPVIEKIKNLFSGAKIPSEYGSVLFKSLGICFLTQFSSDSCKDAGETALASRIELAGKVAVILCALPLFESIVGVSLRLFVGK